MSIVMLFSVSLLIFVTLRILPGDPVSILLGPGNRGIGESQLNGYRAKLGLNRPLLAQYSSWVFNFFRGDLGNSYFSNEPVSQMFKGHVMPTVELTMLAIIFAVIFAIVLAVLGSIWPRSFVDRLEIGRAHV